MDTRDIILLVVVVAFALAIDNIQKRLQKILDILQGRNK